MQQKTKLINKGKDASGGVTSVEARGENTNEGEDKSKKSRLSATSIATQSPIKLNRFSEKTLSDEMQRRINLRLSIKDKILNIYNCFKLIKKTKLMEIIDGKQFISKIFNNSD